MSGLNSSLRILVTIQYRVHIQELHVSFVIDLSFTTINKHAVEFNAFDRYLMHSFECLLNPVDSFSC